MPDPSLSNWTKRLRRDEMPVERRKSHGGSAWSLPMGVSALRQPQDGASEPRRLPVRKPAARDENPLIEPEDAGLTGGTRSLMRRLTGLNITGGAKLERKTPITARVDTRLTQAA